jgi:hypothetical protein
MSVVTGPDAAPNETNIHAAWRMAVARRAAAVYTQNPKLAAAGSLLTETAQLAETNSDADLGSFRAELSERRRAVDPPSNH